MTFHAIHLLRSGFAATLLAGAMALPAAAQSYPSQDVHFICAFPAGSSSDIIVRYMAEKMRPLMGRTIVVENRAGAGGNIATEYLARSKPDGHTIMLHSASAIAANMHLFKKPPVNAETAIQIAATINRQAFMLAVDATKPWKTLADLTAALKQKGDKGTYATNAGTATVMGALYKQGAGLQSTEVVYKVGSDSLNELKSGVLDFGIYDPVYSLSQQRAGVFRILAIGINKRLQAAPELPTMEEQGIPNVDLLGWWSAMVPAGTPKPIVDQLNKWISQVVEMEETKKFLNGFGSDPWVTSPDEGQARLVKDIKDWADYVRVAKIVPQG